MKRFLLILLLVCRAHGQYGVFQRADGSIYGPAASLFFSNSTNYALLTAALDNGGWSPDLPSGTGLLSVTSGVYDTPSTLEARLAAAAGANRTALGLGDSATKNVGTIANTVAAGNDSRITGALQAANNLSDLASASTSRGNLGLGNSATLNVGTAVNTVAAGDDSRITGAAQKSANLSDLASASISRSNLGLGGAAILNVGTIAGTVAAGDDSRITGAAQKSANLSDLASASTARSNLGLGGAAVLNVGTTAGTVAAGDDSRITGAISGTGTLNTHVKYTGTNTIGNSIVTESGTQVSIGGGLTLDSAGTLQWSTDAILRREAANTISLRNSTSQQSFQIYGTYTDASNYRRVTQTITTAGEYQINVEGLGTGATGNAFKLTLNGANALTITSGNTATFSGQIVANNTSKIQWNARAAMTSPGDGEVLIANNAGTDANCWVKLGLNTVAAAGVKRVGATLQARLNDDSGFAAVQTLYDRFGSGTPEANVTAPVGAVYHRTDGGAGTSFYVKESGTGNTGWVAK